MTVIAVRKDKKHITLSCDSQTTSGFQGKTPFDKERMYQGSEKIFEVNGMVIGAAGAVRGASLMRVFAKSHKPKEASLDEVLEFFVEFDKWAKSKDSDFRLIENNFILVVDNKVFEIVDGLLVREVSEFDAIGSGSYLALGAMYFGKTTEEAVEVAKEFDLFCSGKTVTKIIPIA